MKRSPSADLGHFLQQDGDGCIVTDRDHDHAAAVAFDQQACNFTLSQAQIVGYASRQLNLPTSACVIGMLLGLPTHSYFITRGRYTL